MDSTSRETSVMKTFAEQSDSGEFVTNADSFPSTLNDIRGDVPSFPHSKTISSNIFHQELSSMPPSEVTPFLPPSPSNKPPSQDLGHSSGDSHSQNSLNMDSTRIKGFETPKMSNSSPMDGTDFELGNRVLSYLIPPQAGGTKFKRGPGRPRKDFPGLSKSPRPPTNQKIKCFLGGVRGRKKSDLSAPLVNFNSTPLNSDISIGESPPRGTDDTAESDSSSVASSLEKLQDDFSMFPELWPGKVCGFCNLGERSMLGQGELLRLDMPEGFDALTVLKTLAPKSRIERDNAVDKNHKPGLFSRRQKGSGKMKRLVSQSSLESLNEPVDEICGHSEEPESQSVFDTGLGVFFVHYNCALWCDGVEKKSDDTFSNLEVEILRSFSQRCQHCGNFGAGLMCKADGCNVLLHFPCAAVSGAFQDSTTTVCSSHVEPLYASGKISGICTVCDSRNDITSLVMCTSCGRHYHGSCMALNSDPGIRAGWQCPACKVCQACRQAGEEGKLLACDTCDKTYHIFCLRPALSSIPKHSWKCKMCRMCTDCGARTPGSGPSSRWHANFSVCDSCYQQRNKGLACPLCGRAYRHVAQKLMLQCNQCKKYVHGTCDPAADLATYQQKKELYPDYEYICVPCKASGTGLNTLGGNPKVLSILRRSDESEDGINHNMCATSQDSLLSLEDDSFPGTENSNDLVWLEKSLTSNPSDECKPPQPFQTPLFSKDKHFVGIEKLQKRKFLTGRLKVAEKLGPATVGRKTKFNEFTKKRGPKPKLRLFGSPRGTMSRSSSDGFSKDEEPGVENRMVLCSSRDDYVLQQDVCVMCGAFGSDLEGRLISCSQCGQCYHPYCVNVKVTKVILLKGWRCLDCTVCEGCGQRNDESRLILCDECDVSFHIYCIEPPLERVPHGSWKCKWCAVCHYCGSNSSRCSGWFENYTKCGSCASQIQCPVCNVNYTENDLIIKCLKCERWLHGTCDMIKDIKDAEKCADGHYICILCRPMETLPLHLRPPPKIAAKREPPAITHDGLVKPNNNHIFVDGISRIQEIDGIYLSEFGVHQIKSLTLDLPRKKRKKMPNISDMEAGILAAIESVVSGEDDKGPMRDLHKLDNEKDKDSKKKQRNLQKLGIGGFLVRLRGPRFKEEDMDSLEYGGLLIDGEKPKRKPQKRKVKNKLVETFPTYLQEAFFGKPLMNPIKDIDLSSIKDVDPVIENFKSENTIKLSMEELKELESMKSKIRSDQSQKEKEREPNKSHVANEVEGIDLLAMPSDLLDHDLVNTIMNERSIKTEADLSDNRRRLDGTTQLHSSCSDDNNHKDELTDFFSAQFNLESMDSAGLPSMDSKDVEDIFKGVLVEESQEGLFHVAPAVPPHPPSRPRPPGPTTPSGAPPPIIPSTVVPPSSQGSPSVPRPTAIQQNLASPVSFPPPSPYHSEYSNSPQFSPAFSEPPSPWPAPVEDSDQPSSYNQRSILKWEADEGLGHSATISAVLYANINHPELKRDYASWAERSKQIAKIWRGLPTEKRAPYLQKARENRAASRMQKAQQIPKDICNGSTSKKEVAQMSSPENSQTSPKGCNSPQTPSSNEGKNICTTNDKPNSFSTQFPPLCYPHPSSPVAPYVNLKSERRIQNICTSKSPSDKHYYNEKQLFVDQHIKVLTPSEIMKSLPDLSQDECSGFSSRMDQDKVITVNQKTRVETQEERHWKQMQALRQQQSQLQDPLSKDPNSVQHPQIPFSPGPVPGILRPIRHPGNELIGGTDNIRQPLHVSMSQDQKLSPLQSPQVQNQQLPPAMGQMSIRPGPSEMAPPGQISSPMFNPRTGVPPGQHVLRSPVYNRPQFLPTQPSMALSNTNESYNNIQIPEDNTRSNCFPESDTLVSPDAAQYNQKLLGNQNDTTDIGNTARAPLASPQGQETRQHLRDLLQRQQVKKLEQDQISPSSMEPQQNTSRMWSQEEWQKPVSMDNNSIRHSIPGGLPPGHAHTMNMNQFRQPYLPGHPRMSTGLAQNMQTMNRPSDFRMNVSQQQPPDLRARMMLPQQRGMLGGPVRTPQGFHTSQPNQFQPTRNPLDPYGHLVVQSKMQGGGIVSSPSMLAQQLGRPLQPATSGQNPQDSSTAQSSIQAQGVPPNTMSQQISVPSSMSEPSPMTSHLPSDHQELPDSVTAELEKLEQEQHNENNHDTSELADLGMDDDELLGMGADFNILEYADPELDEIVVGGEKTNILDNLDLEEVHDKDENRDKRKEVSGRGVKSEDTEYTPSGTPIQQMKPPTTMNVSTNSDMLSPPNPSYSHTSNMENVNVQPVLRPAQPPPPYPGPPPPYPGRPQLGIRNDCGLNTTTQQPIMGPNMGMNPVGGLMSGGRPPFPHVSPSAMLSNSNHHLSMQQRKTLLLQEQPLLLEDLLEQEKREQLRQNSGLIGAAPEEPLLSDFDFERLKADVLSSSNLPVSLSPPTVGMRSQAGPPQVQEWQMDHQMTMRGPEPSHVEPQHVGSHQPPGSSAAANIARLPLHLTAPPNPPDHPTNEQERQLQIQYEQWLYGQQHVLTVHLKCFETEVNKLRKIKKSLNSKLRQLRKNNNELNDNDSAELDRIGKELPALQKQLDQARKHTRQHNLLITDYRTKQQKRQQMMGISPGGQSGPTQASPLGAASSPLHSTPQSPLMSPSPMQPSPLMQHSPMASPLTPTGLANSLSGLGSPGPASSLSQTSPRGPLNPAGVHMMDDPQFSPNPDGPNRPGPGRIHQMTNFRVAPSSAGGHQIMISQSGGMNPSNPSNPGMVMNRGMNPNMVQMQQHNRPMMDNQMQRMRATLPQDHMRNVNPMTARFQRIGISQEMMMRARPPNTFSNQSQIGISPAGHYSRVPFPSQSPTGSTSLRSPSPMGNMPMGSPPNQMMMSQNRVSPASSPMRRPSGSGSIGSASPMAERSLDNPLTPRNTGSSRPHTPSGAINCPPMEQHPHIHQQQMNPLDNQHFSPMDNCGMGNMGSPSSHKINHNFMQNPGDYQGQMNNDYTNANVNSGGGGGNSHVIPFPTFSFFDGPVKLGLKGGNPFSVVTGHTPSSSNTNVDQITTSNETPITQVSTSSPPNVAHPAGGSTSNIPVVNDTPHQSNCQGESKPTSSAKACFSTDQAPEHKIESPSVNSTETISDTNDSSLMSNQSDPQGETTAPLVNNCLEGSDLSSGSHLISEDNESSRDYPNDDHDNQLQNHISEHVPENPKDNSSVVSVTKVDIHPPSAVVENHCIRTEYVLPADETDEKTAHLANTLESIPINSIKKEEENLPSVEINFSPILTNSISLGSMLNAQPVPSTNSGDLLSGTPSVDPPTSNHVTDLENSLHSQKSIEEQSDVLQVELSSSLEKMDTRIISQQEASDESSPLMHSILAQPQRSVPESNSSSQIQDLSLGEAQSTNALLKQLLQNTGCASTAQTSENVGFSLTSLTKPATTTVHTSNLSEAATRIPQPAPLPVRHTKSQSGLDDDENVIVKNEVTEDSEIFQLCPSPSLTEPIQTQIVQQQLPPQHQQQQPPSQQPLPQQQQPPLQQQPVNVASPQVVENVPVVQIKPQTPTEPVIPVPIVTKMEGIEHFAPITIEAPITSFIETKKADEEIKKAKRRQYQSKRKQAAGKEQAAAVPKKRPRKAGKPEEDFDGFIDNFMVQLRQLPPVGIVEPDLGHSYNICPVFGGGDYSKLNVKGYDLRVGELSGILGRCSLKIANDYYNTKPFGKVTAPPVEKSPPSHRGFYNQEFAAPRTSHFGTKLPTESRTPTPLRETDTPDTIVSSSSPECGARDTNSPDLYPCLKLVETEEDKKQHLRDSPMLHIACPIPIRPLLAAKLAKRQQDLDKENNIKYGSISKLRPFATRENGNITVTLTLSSAAVDEVRLVLRNLANILAIDTPTCQVEKIYPPPDRKMFTFKAKDSTDGVDLQCILNGTAKFCKHCDVLVSNNVIKKNAADLGLNTPNISSSEELSFCSANCFVMFSMSHGVSLRHGDESIKGDPKGHKAEDSKSGAARNLLKPTLKKEYNSNDKKTNTGVQIPVDAGQKVEETLEKKSWKNIRYKYYTPTAFTPNKYKKPTENELTEMLYRLGITVLPSKIPDDTRKCALCYQVGDGVSDGPGRLLNFDVDKWIHLNCALWSEEVYETENGALVNVEVALKQSLTVPCALCKLNGASVKCWKVRCTSVYHVGCAAKDGCAFYKNKSVYCNIHIPKGEKENELTSLSVIRRVYVQRDENRQVAVVMHHGDQHHLLRVGSLIFLNVGQLLPHQLNAFHTRHYIYPVGYKIVRFYWSMTKANKRCQYICSIHETDGKPEFRIAAQESDGKEHVVKSNSAQGAWLQVLEGVAKVRNAQDCIKVFPRYITGEDLFGLGEPAIVKVLESLPGIETLTDYNFKYGRNPLLELPLAINPSGCARSEPKLRTHFKRSHTQRTGAFRASLPSSVLSSSEAACPYSKQFVHSKSSQYKKMKQEWRNNVYLARSKIQGLGLYAARDIERHTMVIEYIGEIIRNELAELREKRYESQNRGIYMFRIDDDRVIDATLCGGLARYINHSCLPNCVAETVEVDRDCRIIIFANRRISRGEELAYDYKFEVEDDQHKIPCLCLAPNCQQWMN